MTNRRERVLLAAAAMAVAGLQIAAFHDVYLDDAYVTFRYAENLASGTGLVFNPGDHVLGTTSPGQALLAAAVFAVVGRDALPAAMAVVGCLAWTAQAALVYALARGPHGRAVAAVVALGVAVGAARSHLFVPLETNLVAACGLAAVWLALRARPRASGLLLGAAVLLRPDAVLLAVPVAAILLRRTGTGGSLRAAAAAAAPVATWVAFATLYYGSAVPRTLGAKAFHASFAAYATHLGSSLPAMALPFAPPAVVAALAWLVALLGARVAIVRKAAGITALLAWGSLHAIAYLALRPDVSFTWHLYPSVLAFTVALLLALADGIARLPRWAAAPLGAGVVACASLGAVKFARTHAHVFWYGSRDAVYREAAAWLRANAQPGDAVEAEEVGTMAYYSGLRFYDHPGLVGPPFDHGRLARGEAPDVRFSVMTQVAEVQAHLPYFGRVPPMQELSYDRWHLWIADLRR